MMMTSPRMTSLRNGLNCMTLMRLSRTAKIATPPIVPQIDPRPPHEHGSAQDDRRNGQEVVAALGTDRGTADSEAAGQQQPRDGRAHRAAHMGADERQACTHPGESSDFGIASGSEQVVAEGGADQDEGDKSGERQRHDRRNRHRPDTCGSEELERPRHFAFCALIAGVEIPLEDQPDTQGRDETVDPKNGDDEAVGCSDAGGDCQGEENRRHHHRVLAVHRLGRDETGQTHDIGNGEVKGCPQNHERLSDGDEAEDAHAGEDVTDVSRTEEAAAGRCHQDGADDEHHDEGKVDECGGVEAAQA